MKYLSLFEQFINEKSIYYPGYEGTDITGYVEGEKAKINHIEVKASRRGEGLGRAAVIDFEKWAKKQGAKYVEIDVYKKSVGFWDKMGYDMEDEFPVIGGYKQDYKDGKKIL